MMGSAHRVVAKSGVSAIAQTGGPGHFQLVFRRAEQKAELPCRGRKPATADPAVLLETGMRELAFFDECDDALEWADVFDLDLADPAVLAEFKAVDEARSNLIALIGETAYEALKLELAMGQAIYAAASGLASSKDE